MSHSNEPEIDPGEVLPPLARAAIASRFGLWFEHHNDTAFLSGHGASFVTLTQAGSLRGCIGSLQAFRPLHDDVKANAVAAAFSDPRFKPLSASEYNEICVEVSLLSPLSAMTVSDENDAIAQFQPGVDGIVLHCGDKRGTFLPQVWESLPDPRRFLQELKRKAGLPADFWSIEIRLYRYHVDKWSEAQLPEGAK